MIEFRQVTGGYDGVPKLTGIDLMFADGGITAIVGPNGCGKSTLLKLAARLLTPFSGTITLDGADIRTMARGVFAKQVSILPQIRNTPNISVDSLVLHGRYPYLKYPRAYSHEDRRTAEEAMMLTGAMALRHKNLLNLSGGERQKVYIAMMLAQDTRTMLLDEPTTFLDIQHQFEIMELVASLKTRGKTIVTVLHDLNMALKYADRIAVMENGIVRICATPRDIYRCGIVDEVFNIHTEVVETTSGSCFLFTPKIRGEE